jgi:hypothetical protein
MEEDLFIILLLLIVKDNLDKALQQLLSTI